MREYILEIDVDGVLANMDGSYKPYIEHIIPNYSEGTHITEWGIPSIKEKYPEAYEIIFGLYNNPVFIRNLPRFKGIEKQLRAIDRVVKETNGGIVIHTHIFNEECAIERRLWLEELKKDTGVDMKIDISVGEEKRTLLNSKFIIEDNINNLKRSGAACKMLMRRSHNRGKTFKDIGEFKKGFILKDLNIVPYIIQEYLKEETRGKE